MKAVILAGGAGTRLMPISADLPKPMVPLPGGPLLWHTVQRLKKQGVTDITMALCHLSASVTDYFGDGHELGLNIRYHIECAPLGTAGAARQCVREGETEDILVLSGDALWDMDLEKCLRFHREKESAATLLLNHEACPTEYGLVHTDSEGKILRFMEKPGWAQVSGSVINTGIYIIKGEYFDLIPRDAPWDFGKDLFTQMLREDIPLYGCDIRGYWRDIGSCSAYLQAVKDLVSGKIAPQPPRTEQHFDETEIIAPCCIEPGAQIGTGCRIGPNCYISAHTVIGSGCRVEGSALLDCEIREGCRLKDAVVCHGAVLEPHCRLGEDSVIGAGALVGSGTLVEEAVRIWPNRRVAEGSVLHQDLKDGDLKYPPVFASNGAITGEPWLISADFCAALGRVCRPEGQVGLSGTGDSARFLMDALCAGLTQSGTDVTFTDARNRAESDYAAALYGFDMSIFVQAEPDRVSLFFRGKSGAPLGRSRERAIESALRRGDHCPAAQRPGTVERITGVAAAHRQAAVRMAGDRVGRIESAQEDPILADLLRHLPEGKGDALTLTPTGSGRRLQGSLPDGTRLDESQMLMLTGLLLLETKVPALPFVREAPFALARQADHTGVPMLSDPRWDQLPARCRAMEDGLFAAALLARALAGRSPMQLFDLLKPCHRARADISLTVGRCFVMDRLPSEFEPGEAYGLCRTDSRGTVLICPSSRSDCLHILAEAVNMETAESLCEECMARIREIEAGG